MSHPVFSDFSAKLPEDLQKAFTNLIGLLGSSIPVASLHLDFAGSPESVKAEDADEASLKQLAESMVPRLLAQGTEKSRIADILCQIQPFKESTETSRKIINDIADREITND